MLRVLDTARAVSELSPVHIMIFIPIRCSVAIASGVVDLTGSAMAMAPSNTLPSVTQVTVFPCFCRSCAWFRSSLRRAIPLFCRYALFPTLIVSPRTSACAPAPGWLSKSVFSGISISRFSDSLTMALASGCSECLPMAATNWSSLKLSIPVALNISTTWGCPSVNVPVLSFMRWVIFPSSR